MRHPPEISFSLQSKYLILYLAAMICALWMRSEPTLTLACLAAGPIFVLFSRSFDSNIACHRKKLNLKGENLSEIIAELPESEQKRFKNTFTQLKVSFDEVKTLNAKCQELIEERLYSLDKAIKEIDRSTGSSYGKGGDDSKRTGDSPHILSKSV